jgi:hypothetical protein
MTFDLYEKDGNEIDNCRVVGYFVSDTFDFNVEEKKSQPMTTTTLRNR